MYAIVEMSGKQYRVQEGDRFQVEKIAGEKGSTVRIDRVLMVGGSADAPVLGRPVVPGAFVEAEVLGEVKGPKLTVYKMKRRKNYRRKAGHRQTYTALRVTGIRTA